MKIKKKSIYCSLVLSILYSVITAFFSCDDENVILKPSIDTVQNRSDLDNKDHHSSSPKCFTERMKIEDITTPLELAGQIEYEAVQIVKDLAKQYNVDISDIDFEDFSAINGKELLMRFRLVKEIDIAKINVGPRLKKMYELGKEKYKFSREKFIPGLVKNPLADGCFDFSSIKKFANGQISEEKLSKNISKNSSYEKNITNSELIKNLTNEEINNINLGLLQAKLVALCVALNDNKDEVAPLILINGLISNLGSKNIEQMRDNLRAGKYS